MSRNLFWILSGKPTNANPFENFLEGPTIDLGPSVKLHLQASSLSILWTDIRLMPSAVAIL